MSFRRFISHSNRYVPSPPFFKNIKSSPLTKQMFFQTCLLMHKFTYRNQDLPDTFRICSSPPHIHTHIKLDTAAATRTRTSTHRFNITFRGPKLWSELSSPLRSMSPHSAFKKQLKRLLLPAWSPYPSYANWFYQPFWLWVVCCCCVFPGFNMHFVVDFCSFSNR